MGKAIAAQAASSCFLLAQDATLDRLLQRLDAGLYLYLGQLPQQLRARRCSQHRTDLHQLAGGLREWGQTGQDQRAHRGRQQRALGPLLRHKGRHLHRQFQLEDSIRIHPWHQPLPIAQQLERLQQVQRLPSGLRKQDVAQGRELRLPLCSRCCPCCGGLIWTVRTPLTPIPRALCSHACDGI